VDNNHVMASCRAGSPAFAPKYISKRGEPLELSKLRPCSSLALEKLQIPRAARDDNPVGAKLPNGFKARKSHLSKTAKVGPPTRHRDYQA
jgi:hypothetical protein